MGCTQSSAAKSPGAAAAGPPSSSPAEAAAKGDSSRAVSPAAFSNPNRASSPTPRVVVSTVEPSTAAAAAAAEAGDEEGLPPIFNARADTAEVVGSDCTPPPGGREGGLMKVGAAPANLLDIEGEACGNGRIKRENVVLEGGATYEGMWKGSVIDGIGTLKASDGSSYTGEFSSGKVEGKGLWRAADGLTYEGQWKAGRANGHGKLTHPDGSSYVGAFKMDIKHGHGVETWADGTVFEGEFKDGDKVGKGKIRFPDGSTYEGTFKDDVIDGVGTYVWASQNKYEGEWKNGLMNGRGAYSWAGGQYSKYEGSFVAGIREGKGCLFVRDGRKYSGVFHKNKLEGEVREIFPSGKSRTGIWKDGAFQRWLDGSQRVTLTVHEEESDDEGEPATSIFSNPDVYTEVYKTKERKRMKVKEGILRGKTKNAEKPAGVQKEPAGEPQNAQT